MVKKKRAGEAHLLVEGGRSEHISKAMSQKQSNWPLVVLASSIMGACFGISFYKSHVYEPQIIRGQFLFQRFLMLKVL